MEYYEKALVVSPNDATVLCSYGVLLSEEAFNKWVRNDTVSKKHVRWSKWWYA
jgi:hypothetical protein